MVKSLRSIEFNSDISNLNRVEQFVEEICDEFNIFNNYFGNILIAVSAAVENAILHGNENDSSRKVSVTFQSKQNGLQFTIEDEGIGFDYKNLPDPTDISGAGEEGRGVFLIKSLSDNVIFENNGSTIVILFSISSINHETSVQRSKQMDMYLKGVKTQQPSST